jgi:hypothetical protein
LRFAVDLVWPGEQRHAALIAPRRALDLGMAHTTPQRAVIRRGGLRLTDAQIARSDLASTQADQLAAKQ